MIVIVRQLGYAVWLGHPPRLPRSTHAGSRNDFVAVTLVLAEPCADASRKGLVPEAPAFVS